MTKVSGRLFHSGARSLTLHRSHFSDSSANSAKVIGRSKSRSEIAAAEHSGRFSGNRLFIRNLLVFIFYLEFVLTGQSKVSAKKFWPYTAEESTPTGFT